MHNTSKVSKITEAEKPRSKRSFSYQDIINLQSKHLYSSMGRMINSRKPTSQRTTFGTSERKDQKKVLEPYRMAQIDNIGRESKGPGAYLPPRYTLQNGQIIDGVNPTEKLMFKEAPSHKFPKSEQKPFEKQKYNYYNYKNDELKVSQADLKRKKSTPSIIIGVEERFPKERLDKVMPGPTYDPVLKPQILNAPKYSLGGSRRTLKGQDFLVPTTSTTNLVGPSTYFSKGRSQSTEQLNRIPLDSKIKKEPAVSFTKGPKFLAQYKSTVDQTYDIKTKTIMASYDFQYDAGKGLQTGLSFMKKNIIESSKRPFEKNKMKSFTMNKATRQMEEKRGTFIKMMSNIPTSVKINHPKF